jgi:protein SCO1
MTTLRSVSLLVLVVAATALAAGCGSSSSASQPATTTTPTAQAALDAPGTTDNPGPAPAFAGHNHLGQPVRLADYRGKAVLLTFIYDHCPDVCPLIMGNLHSALEQLGPKARDVQVIAVSVDPRGDTRRTVTRFLSDHEMTGRAEYVIGTKRHLAQIWKKYGVKVQGTPDSREVDHSAAVYGITGKGTLLALYPADFKPAWIVHDVPILARS